MNWHNEVERILLADDYSRRLMSFLLESENRGQNLEEYLYRLILIDWTMDFDGGDSLTARILDLHVM